LKLLAANTDGTPTDYDGRDGAHQLPNFIRRAISLDVVELLPDVSDPDLLDRKYRRSNAGWQVLKQSRSAKFLKFWQRMAATLRLPDGGLPDPTGDVLLATFTINQWRALTPVDDALRKRGVPACLLDGRHLESFYNRLTRQSFLRALPFLPVLLVRMLLTRGYQGKSFRWGLDRYWQAYGAYVVIRRWFRRQRPSAVVVSNDHTFWPRVMVAAAKDEGIPTIYMQHAPVTGRFPPLTMDYALLEGQHSLQLYAGIGKTSTEVYLVGIPRMDAHIGKVNERTQARAVGFCLGAADPLERAADLLHYLAAHCPDLRFVVRLHPRSRPEMVDYWQNVCRELGADFSDSHHEHPFEFLSRVDAVIAGGSGIILEAALMNVTPIMYELKPGIPDWYGFAADGLCPMFSEPQPVAELLNQQASRRNAVRDRTKYYCATVGTSFDGHSSDLAAELIEHIANGTVRPPEGWRPLAIDNIIAFERE
jgi:hypothetical protein